MWASAAVTVGGVACNSDLLGGWSDPVFDPDVTSATVDLDEGLFPGQPLDPSLVYKDWRVGHDPMLPCPEEMAFVADSFCIDRWEGSLVQIVPSGELEFRATRRVENTIVRAQSRPGVVPQAYISGAEAQRACQMAGKRLCTNWEWWRACAGSRKTIYPYGTVHVPRRCNEARSLHPVLQLYGADAGPTIWWVDAMNNPAINEQSATVSVTGARPGCVSQDGVFDMVGNLHEWTSDPAGEFQGGAYSGEIKLGCQYKTTVHGFSYHDYSTGFRCCSDPYSDSY